MSIVEQKPRDIGPVPPPRPKHGVETEYSYSWSSLSAALEPENRFPLRNLLPAYKLDALIGDDGTEYALGHGDDERDEEADEDDDEEEATGESCTRGFLLRRLGKMVLRSFGLECCLTDVLLGVA